MYYFSPISCSSEDEESFDVWKHTLYFCSYFWLFFIFALFFRKCRDHYALSSLSVQFLWRNCKYNWIFGGIHEFKWGNNKGKGAIKELWFICCTSLQQKLCCWIPCRWSHWTMIIFQKMKGDKNKKAIKQISRCLEGHDYYWLTVFCIINVPKVWQLKL